MVGTLLKIATRYRRVAWRPIVDDRIGPFPAKFLGSEVFLAGDVDAPCFATRLVFQLAFEATSGGLAAQPLTFTIEDPSNRLAAFVAAVPDHVVG
jgi:hypothetical protein